MPQSLARRGRRQLPSSQFLGRRARLEPLEDRTLLSINVTQYRYDGVSSGSNPNETSLTPDNVVAGNFTKIYNTVVDGQVLRPAAGDVGFEYYDSRHNQRPEPRLHCSGFSRRTQCGIRGHGER